MLLSSGVVWRHATFEAFRQECPDGDPALQRLVFDRLDGDIEWLESLGAVVTERGTGNERTYAPTPSVTTLAFFSWGTYPSRR